METEQILMRKQRGYEIAKNSRIQQTEKGWKVPSQTGAGYYVVVSNGFGAECNCPDHEVRKTKCKHIWAVELIVTQEVDNEGNITVTKTIKKTYSQEWKNYDTAHKSEKRLFMKLLKDLTTNINQPIYTFGRPNKILGDSVYSMIFKVYSTFSSRRFFSDMETAKENGLIEQITPRSSMSDYFNKKELTPLLAEMVVLTSLPLRTIEKDFALDSTGFGTSNFQRWFSFKHGKEIDSRKWVKCHFMTGVKSNIVTAVKITSQFEGDSPQLKELVDKTAENFDMQEVSGDKAYLSRDNLDIIAEAGATPYIPYKSNSVAKARGSAIWKKMYHYFMLNNEQFLEHYHKRSNVETSVFMIKSKFGDSVRSKSWTAQVNEVLCKVIAHNICCVIMEMHTLGIEADFVREVGRVSEMSA